MMKLLFRLFQIAMLYVFVRALREQLERPPEERDWHGKVGFVPYDFRIPTLGQIRDAYWNPDSEVLFTSRVLGIGWAINFAHLLRIVNELREQARAMQIEK
jgi:hypothetical protein